MMDICGEVVRQIPLKANYWLLELRVGKLADQARPGQFVHVRVPGLALAALRRPFSIFGADAGVLRILYKNVGRGTSEMARLEAGSEIQVIGPLGNGFPLEPQGFPVLVAGGYGVAPLSFLASKLKVKGVLLAGGRSEEDILAVETFDKLGWPVKVATQDGSLGTQGVVTVLLDSELRQLHEKGVHATLYACGPDGMLRAVAERALAVKCPAWLSLDKHMVCGVGACLACVQKLRREDGSEWIGRVCHDGPIFEAREIVW